MIKHSRLVKSLVYCALILFLFCIPLFIKNIYYIHILIVIGINVILASSLRTIGTTGQLSLAHAGFLAIGAYGSAALVLKLGISSWAALPLAGILAALVALAVGYPFVRVRKVYFAMLTLFLGQVIQLIIIQCRTVTGGSSGLLGIPPPNPINFFGLFNIVFDNKVTYYYYILIIMFISLLVLYRIEYSKVGRTLLAIQQGDFIAESVGIDVTGFKVFAWVVGCFFAGIAGAFSAHYYLVLAPTGYGVLQAIYIMIYMIVGGRRKFYGAIIGAVVLTIAPEFFRGLQEWQPLIFAAILLVITFFLPGGLIDLPKLIKSQMEKIRKVGATNA